MRWACFLVCVNSITWSVKVLVNKAGRKRGLSWQLFLGSYSTCTPSSSTKYGHCAWHWIDRHCPCPVELKFQGGYREANSWGVKNAVRESAGTRGKQLRAGLSEEVTFEVGRSRILQGLGSHSKESSLLLSATGRPQRFKQGRGVTWFIMHKHPLPSVGSRPQVPTRSRLVWMKRALSIWLSKPLKPPTPQSFSGPKTTRAHWTPRGSRSRIKLTSK